MKSGLEGCLVTRPILVMIPDGRGVEAAAATLYCADGRGAMVVAAAVGSQHKRQQERTKKIILDYFWILIAT